MAALTSSFLEVFRLNDRNKDDSVCMFVNAGLENSQENLTPCQTNTTCFHRCCCESNVSMIDSAMPCTSLPSDPFNSQWTTKSRGFPRVLDNQQSNTSFAILQFFRWTEPVKSRYRCDHRPPYDKASVRQAWQTCEIRSGVVTEAEKGILS